VCSTGFPSKHTCQPSRQVAHRARDQWSRRRPCGGGRAASCHLSGLTFESFSLGFICCLPHSRWQPLPPHTELAQLNSVKRCTTRERAPCVLSVQRRGGQSEATSGYTFQNKRTLKHLDLVQNLKTHSHTYFPNVQIFSIWKY